MEKRLEVFDYMRVVAALAVIAIHVSSGYAAVRDIAFVFNQVVRFAVPMFIILSGFLLYYTGSKRRKTTYFAFLGKRLKKIFIPYLLWTLIYMLYNVRHSLGKSLNADFLMGYLKNIALGRGAAHLYFIVVIIQIYIIYELLEWFIKGEHDKQWLAVTFAVTTYFQLGIYLYRWNIHIIPRIPLNYYILLPTWVFYFVLGMYFAKHEAQWREKLRVKALLLGFLWLISLVTLIIDSKLSGTYGSSMKPTVMLYSMASFFFFYAFFTRYRVENKLITDIIQWVSNQSFFIYLCHLLLMELLKSFTKIMGIGGIWNGSKGMLLYFIAVSAVSLIFAYMSSFLPFVGLLGGVPRTLASARDKGTAVGKTA